MRHVRKQAEPASFIAWKASGNAEWKPSYDNLRNPEKRALHHALLAEQGHTCCYCGRSTNEENSHIEHFKPQEAYEHDALDYGNLHASCLRTLGPGDPLHCGHGKGSEFNPGQVISPLDPTCESRFLYVGQSGAITAKDPGDDSAAHMVTLLKLDIPYLRELRSQVLQGYFPEEILAKATDAQLQVLIADADLPDISGNQKSFAHVIRAYGNEQVAKRRGP